jgi:hypothetical protein
VTPLKTPPSKELLGFTYTRPGSLPRTEDIKAIPSFPFSELQGANLSDGLFDEEEGGDLYEEGGEMEDDGMLEGDEGEYYEDEDYWEEGEEAFGRPDEDDEEEERGIEVEEY